MVRRLLILVLACSPGPALAVSKEILELQRDIATLQDLVRQLQRSQDEKLASINTLAQQAVNAANEANRSVAGIQGGIQQTIRDMQDKVVAPVVGVNTRISGMSDDLKTLSNAVADLTAQVNRMAGQLKELNDAVKALQAPPVQPPTQTVPGGTPTAGAVPDTPTIPAQTLYDNARRDMSGGKLDVALTEYQQYLKWYGSTDLAPNAQYYIAYIHFSQGDYDSAVKEYDTVLEKYPNNNKTPDAMFGKGLALVKIGRRTEGAKEFQELIKKFPKNDLASQACTQLKALGYATCTARAAAPKGGTRTTAKRK
jgi:tol-pal system protein YbgF